jgi:hypothetical protein
VDELTDAVLLIEQVFKADTPAIDQLALKRLPPVAVVRPGISRVAGVRQRRANPSAEGRGLTQIQEVPIPLRLDLVRKAVCSVGPEA